MFVETSSRVVREQENGLYCELNADRVGTCECIPSDTQPPGQVGEIKRIQQVSSDQERPQPT